MYFEEDAALQCTYSKAAKRQEAEKQQALFEHERRMPQAGAGRAREKGKKPGPFSFYDCLVPFFYVDPQRILDS